jgi:RNA polymerase sigma-70 factor, ECF subfamily
MDFSASTGLPAFRFEAPLRAWAFRVAWRASARFRRDPWRARRQRLATSAASRIAISVTRAGLKDPDDRLERLRRTLAPEDHTLLVLRLDREMTWDEIALVLSDDGRNATSAALRKRFERLKNTLGRRARRSGILRQETVNESAVRPWPRAAGRDLLGA